MNYFCSKCGLKESVYSLAANCQCGGLWKLEFTPPKFDLTLVDRETWGIFRYREFMPVLDDSWRQVTLGEGLTPIVELDHNVLLKMDYMMPTLSFKDRGAAMLVSHMKHIGVESVVQDSSGNAGNSIAAYCAKAGIQCEIYVPEGTSSKKIDMIKAHQAEVNIVSGTRDHCAEVCREKVAAEKVYYASHVYNPFFYEGTKTYIYEVYEQLNRIPENIFVPLGNGTLFIGLIRGLEDLLKAEMIERVPRIYAVQSENCAPFKKAVDSAREEVVKGQCSQTLAEGIAIGEPMRGGEILEYIYKYEINVILAPESGILDARNKLAAKGIYAEYTAAATYAAYLRYVEDNGELKDCLIPMCGAGLKSS